MQQHGDLQYIYHVQLHTFSLRSKKFIIYLFLFLFFKWFDIFIYPLTGKKSCDKIFSPHITQS